MRICVWCDDVARVLQTERAHERKYSVQKSVI